MLINRPAIKTADKLFALASQLSTRTGIFVRLVVLPDGAVAAEGRPRDIRKFGEYIRKAGGTVTKPTRRLEIDELVYHMRFALGDHNGSQG
jgi:hypothetical protein